MMYSNRIEIEPDGGPTPPAPWTGGGVTLEIEPDGGPTPPAPWTGGGDRA